MFEQKKARPLPIDHRNMHSARSNLGVRRVKIHSWACGLGQPLSPPVALSIRKHGLRHHMA